MVERRWLVCCVAAREISVVGTCPGVLATLCGDFWGVLCVGWFGAVSGGGFGWCYGG